MTNPPNNLSQIREIVEKEKRITGISLSFCHQLITQSSSSTLSKVTVFTEDISYKWESLFILITLMSTGAFLQIFPGIGHNLQNIDKYLHKILLNFYRGCFRDKIEERNPNSDQLGLLEDISSWLR